MHACVICSFDCEAKASPTSEAETLYQNKRMESKGCGDAWWYVIIFEVSRVKQILGFGRLHFVIWGGAGEPWSLTGWVLSNHNFIWIESSGCWSEWLPLNRKICSTCHALAGWHLSTIVCHNLASPYTTHPSCLCNHLAEFLLPAVNFVRQWFRVIL